MIPAQRRQDILKLITNQGSGAIAELSSRYGVSEMTIRRDLKALEQEGYVRVTHGGAVHVGAQRGEPLYAAKRLENIAQKDRIAHYAASHFVDDDDIIILESGTTVTSMVKFLTAKQRLTVVTNGLFTTYELRSLLSNATVICTGGILRDVSFTFVGPVAERFFHEFYARKLFLSAIGFTPESGLTDPQMIDTQVKKAMIQAADQVIVLIDSSKFGVRSFTPVISANEIDVLITDEGAPDSMLSALRREGIDVHVVPQTQPVGAI
jgi:DeoR/GlpR family transcriptional regulator of sugar metabolism